MVAHARVPHVRTLGTDRAQSLAEHGRALVIRDRHGARGTARETRTRRAFSQRGAESRSGAGAGTIGRLVGTRLNWKVYDHEILEAIAHRMEMPTDEVRAFDELAPSVVQDWILPLREEHYAPQEAYLDHLAKLVEAIGRAGDPVVVGRGAGFILPARGDPAACA